MQILVKLDGFLAIQSLTRGSETRVDKQKIGAVKSQSRPVTPIEFCRFLCLAGYYRRFGESFSSIFMTKLTDNTNNFQWSKSCELSFQKLKENFMSELVLTLPEGMKGYVVYCDASQISIGCVPMLHDKVITYASR